MTTTQQEPRDQQWIHSTPLSTVNAVHALLLLYIIVYYCPFPSKDRIGKHYSPFPALYVISLWPHSFLCFGLIIHSFIQVNNGNQVLIASEWMPFLNIIIIIIFALPVTILIHNCGRHQSRLNNACQGRPVSISSASFTDKSKRLKRKYIETHTTELYRSRNGVSERIVTGRPTRTLFTTVTRLLSSYFGG